MWFSANRCARSCSRAGSGAAAIAAGRAVRQRMGTGSGGASSFAQLGVHGNRGGEEGEQVRRAVVWGLIVLSLWLAACQSGEARRITENEAKEIALKHLGWTEERVAEIGIRRDGENWRVHLVFLRLTPGAETTVLVSGDGRILEVHEGF